MSSLKIDRLQLDIIINNDASRKKLYELEDSMKRMRAEMKKIPQESEKWKTMDAELKKLQAEHDSLIDKIGLTGLTTKELSARMRELQNILKHMPDSPLRKEYVAQVNAIKARLAELNGTAKTTAFTFSKMADGFNKYFTMFTAFAASFAGVIFGARKAVDAYNQFDDKVADVMKTTGMTKNEVLELDKSLQKIDTRTAQDELLSLARVAGKLGITGKEDVEGFVKAADKIRVALAEDLGGDVEEAINAVGKLTDIFGLQEKFGIEQSMLKVGSAINSLGAASTANEAYLVEFTKRMAGVAPAANVSVDQILGLGATLDQFGQQAEMSSTAVAAVYTDMFKNPGQYAKIAGMNIKDFNDLLAKDSNEAFIRFLQGLKGNNEGLGEMANKLDTLGIEGKRSISVLGVLSNNTETLRKQQQLANEEFNKGTSLTEEFNIKNNTAAAQLEKKRKELALITRQLGEKFAPIMTFSTNIVGKFLKLIGAGIDFYRNNAKAINILLVTITAYIVATKLAAMWQALMNKEGFIYLAYSKLRVFWDNATKAGILLLTAAQGLFTGSLVTARFAMSALTKSMSINPFVALATVVVALGYAIYELGKNADAATRFTKAMADVQAEVNKNLAQEKVELTALVNIINDKNRSDADREAALKRLNKISPEYLGNLDMEAFKTGKAKAAIDEYMKSLEKKWRMEVLESKIKEEMAKATDIENSSLEDNVKWYNSLWNTIYTGGNWVLTAHQNQKDALKNKNNELNDQIELINRLRQEYEAVYKFDDKSEETNGDEPKEGAEKLIDGVLHVYKNGKWVPKDKNTDKPGDDTDEQKIKDFETYRKRLLELQNELLQDQKKIIWDKYQEELLAIDKLLISESQKNELRNALQEKMVNDMQAIDDVYLANEIALNDAIVDEEKKKWDEIDKLRDDNAKKEKVAQEEAVKDFAEKLKKQIDLYSQFTIEIGKGLADFIDGQEDALKQTAKNIILLALDVLEKQVTLSITSATVQSFAMGDSVATFGASGLIRAAVLAALIKGAFAGVKQIVANYAAGNLHEVIGASDGRTYKAGWEPFSSNKIYNRPTLLGNKLVGEAGPELVLNAPTTRNLYFNYPELANALRSVYVPQYAAGNLNPKPETRNPDYETAMLNLLVKLSKRLDEPIHADVSWMDIKKKSDQYSKITRTSSGG